MQATHQLVDFAKARELLHGLLVDFALVLIIEAVGLISLDEMRVEQAFLRDSLCT